MSRLTLTERTNLLNSMTPQEREAYRRGEFSIEQFAELRLGMSEQDFAEGKARAERASTPAPAPEPLEAPTSFAGEVGQSFYGGLQNAAGNRLTSATSEETTGLASSALAGLAKTAFAGPLAAAQVEQTGTVTPTSFREYEQQARGITAPIAQAILPNQEWSAALSAEGRERIRLAREATEQQRNQWFQGDGRLAEGEQFLRQLGQDAADPSVAVSMIPFAGSSLAGVMAYDNAYVKYIEEGNSDEVASQLAAQEAGIEMGTAAIPMGKLLQRVPGLRSLFPNAAQRVAGDVASRGLAAGARRVTGSALEEGSQEFLAGVGQEEVLRQTDLDLSQQTEERRANLADRLSVENVQDKLYQGLVGAVAGGGIRTTGEVSGFGARMEAAENATEAFRQTVLNQNASRPNVTQAAAQQAAQMQERAAQEAQAILNSRPDMKPITERLDARLAELDRLGNDADLPLLQQELDSVEQAISGVLPADPTNAGNKEALIQRASQIRNQIEGIQEYRAEAERLRAKFANVSDSKFLRRAQEEGLAPTPQTVSSSTTTEAVATVVDPAVANELGQLDADVQKSQEAKLKKQTTARNAKVRNELRAWSQANPVGNFATPEARIEAFAKARQEIEAANPVPSSVSETTNGEPPVPAGMTRLYHGSATPGRYDGDAWFSSSKEYARNYRGATNSELQYVDVPTEFVNSKLDPDGYGQTVEKGFTFQGELPSSFTGLRKPLAAKPLPEGGIEVDTADAGRTPADKSDVQEVINAKIPLESADKATVQTKNTGRPSTLSVLKKLYSEDTVESRALARQIITGDVEVVDSASEIPTNAKVSENATGVFFEDIKGTKRTFLIAPNALGKKKLGSVGLHEYTHDKQTQEARDGLAQNVVDGIGAANAKTLLANIDRSAKSGNAIAQRVAQRLQLARTAYEQSGRSAAEVDAAMDREVVTYLLEENSASKGSSGSFGSVIRNLKRMVETTPENFNDMTFDQMTEVMQGQMKRETLNRLSEVSKDRTKSAAPIARTQPEDNATGLESIIGKNSKIWDKMKEEGAFTYFDDIDNKEKMVLSNIKDTLKFIPNENTEPSTLENVLSATKLFEAYPSFKNMTVIFAKGKNFYVNPRQSPDGTEYMAVDPTDGEQEILSTIIHELQHAIQYREGFSTGGTPRNYDEAVAETTRAHNEYVQKLNSTVAGLGFGSIREVVKQLRSDRELMGVAKNSPAIYDTLTTNDSALTTLAIADMLVSAADPASPLGSVQRYRSAWNRAKAKEETIYRDYRRIAGEAEAFQVEQDRLLSQQELNEMGNPMLRYRDSNGKRITKDELIPKRAIAAGERKITPLESVSEVTSGPTKLGIAANENFATRMFIRAFGPAGGTYDTLVEKMENVKGIRAEYVAKAEDFSRKLDRAIAKEADVVGTDQYDLAQQIEQQLEKINNLPESQRATAFNKWADERGDVGKYVRELNKLQRSLSIAILRQRQDAAKRGVELTKEEARVFQVILANLDTYTTRAYAAFMGDAGKQFADRTIKALEAELAREKGEKVGLRRNITEAVRGKDSKLAKNARVALDFLLTNNILIPPADQLNKLGTDKLTTLYRTWYNKQEGVPVSRQEMIQRLGTVLPTPEQAQEKALLALKDLLGLGDKGSPIATYYRGAKLNRGILQARENIPKELRDVLGEVTDPSARYLITVSRQADLVARTKMLLEIAEEGEGTLWSATREGRFVNELRGKDYGPMEGRYVDQATWDSLKGVLEVTQKLDEALSATATNASSKALVVGGVKAWEGWVKAVGYSKLATVVASPANFAYNGAGSIIMAANNGVFDPRDIRDGLAGAFGVMRAASGLGVTDKGLEILRSYTTDSAAIGEIRSQEARQLGKKIAEMTEADAGKLRNYLNSGFSGIARAVGAGLITMKEAYAFMDVWTKAAAYYSNKKFYENINKAGNKGWTAEQIERKAAYLANQTNISYSRAIPAAKLLEKTGFIGQFMTYFSEVFRATAANGIVIAQMMMEAKAAGVTTAEGRAYLGQAAKRFIGMAFSTAFSVYLLEALSAFGDDDEEKDKVRALVEELSQDQALRYVGVDANGQYVFENMSRIDPIGPLTDVLRAINNAEDGQAVEDGLASLGSLVFESALSRRLGQSVTAAGDARATGRLEENSKLAQIMPSTYATGANIMGDSWVLAANVADAFLPGWSNALLSETNPPVVGGGDPNGIFGEASEYDRLSANALLAAGARLVRTDPDRAANTAARDFTSITNEYRDRMTNVIRNRNASPEEAFAVALEGIEEENAALQRLQRVYEGLEVVQGRRGAMATLRENRVPADVIGHLMNGRPYSTQIVTPSYLNTLERNLLNEARGDRERQAEIRQYMRTLRNLNRGAN